MVKYNEDNERIKRKYLIFLREAKGLSEATLDYVAKAISRFEVYTNYRNFKAFHFQQAVGFKKHLSKQIAQRTGKPLSQATLLATSRHLRAFFQWLAQESGYRSRVKYSDAEYFNISEKDARTARGKRKTPVATVEQIKHTISLMPSDTDVALRDRALMAFTLLTGARDRAITSFKLKHIDLKAGSVFQDARDVKTKFSKTFTTYFFPIGDEIRTIFEDWCHHLQTSLLFGPDDPVFPRTKTGLNDAGEFHVLGVSKEHWKEAAAIRRIFKAAFKQAGLPSFNPHSFRNTLVSLGEKLCETPEEFKAWSQNLGHEQVMTTFLSYGEVAVSRQSEILNDMRKPKTHEENIDAGDLLKQLSEMIEQTRTTNNGNHDGKPILPKET